MADLVLVRPMKARVAAIRTHGLTHIALAVRDAKRSLRFYQKVFGVVAVYQEAGFIEVLVNTVAFMLNIIYVILALLRSTLKYKVNISFGYFQ